MSSESSNPPNHMITIIIAAVLIACCTCCTVGTLYPGNFLISHKNIVKKDTQKELSFTDELSTIFGSGCCIFIISCIVLFILVGQVTKVANPE